MSTNYSFFICNLTSEVALDYQIVSYLFHELFEALKYGMFTFSNHPVFYSLLTSLVLGMQFILKRLCAWALNQLLNTEKCGKFANFMAVYYQIIFTT